MITTPSRLTAIFIFSAFWTSFLPVDPTVCMWMVRVFVGLSALAAALERVQLSSAEATQPGRAFRLLIGALIFQGIISWAYLASQVRLDF